MAFLCSRTYLGTVLKQGIVVTRVPSLSHTLLRRDASTATKLKATPKSTGKASSPKATRKKTPPSSPVQKKPTPATSKTVSGTQAQAQAPPTQNDVVQETATDSADAKAYQEMSEEEREKEIQRLMQMSELMPTMDFFGQEIHSTLDVMIPYPKNKSLPFTKKELQRFKSNVQNSLKNAVALNMLSAFNAIPGVWTVNMSWFSRIRHKFKLFGVQSTKSDSLIAPFRQIILEQYEEFNMALASRNERDVKKLTTWDYQAHTLDVMKKSLKNNPGGRLIWQLHRVVEPVQVLSLRVTQGHFEDAEPKFGNRLVAHVLVKFDTEQSLEIYDRQARPLHTAAELEKKPKRIDAQKKPDDWRVPAVKRRVQEYLVLEKRMWVKGPWVIREQMWPTWQLEETETETQESKPS